MTALENIDDQFRISSYRLEQPQVLIKQEVSIPVDTKDLIDKVFHPSGAVRPKEVIFEFTTAGPGLAEREEASMLWLASRAFLVLESALLDTLSVGILKPFHSVVEMRFNPGFCPAHVAARDFAEQDRRLVLVRERLLEALQDHPPGIAMQQASKH